MVTKGVGCKKKLNIEKKAGEKTNAVGFCSRGFVSRGNKQLEAKIFFHFIWE